MYIGPRAHVNTKHQRRGEKNRGVPQRKPSFLPGIMHGRRGRARPRPKSEIVSDVPQELWRLGISRKMAVGER